MKDIFQQLKTRLRYQIIIPFLVLTLVVGLVGYGFVVFLLARASQESFDKQLAEVTRVARHTVIDQERTNLQFLIEVVFAPANQNTGAPAVSEALAFSDTDGLRKALNPYFKRGLSRSLVHLDRMIAFDRNGHSLADFERIPTSSDSAATQPLSDTVAITSTSYVTNTVLDFSKAWFVPQILAAQEDDLGDKYAGLLQLPAGDGTTRHYFGTIAPVVRNDEVVGGIIIAMDVRTLAERLAERSKADIITFYDGYGAARVSTMDFEDGSLAQLNIPDDEVKEISASTLEADAENAVFDIKTFDKNSYQFSYTTLEVRQWPVGILAASLSYDDVNSWGSVRSMLVIVTALLMIGIIAIGIFSARRITRPVDELVYTAHAVTSGDLSCRSQVTAQNEIGVLSDAFNQMTEYLTQALAHVMTQYSERSAIVESIADGIILCNNAGEIQLANPATYRMLGLDMGNHAPLPGRFTDLPLAPLNEPIFGSKSNDIYMIGEYYVRLSESPVVTSEGASLGNVYVLQDLTAEVKMDRAKTSFIATISHEMRTPLTSMRGNTDMMLHGLAGPLQGEQKSMLETISQQTNNMTRLINNMIVIAGLESGSLVVEPEPISLKRAIEESLWPLRKQIKVKKLTMTIDIPPDIEVNADRIQLRNIMQQLIDNARVYTDEGSITVQAVPEPEYVRVDVIDTGCGIEPELVGQVFERFVRGEGSNDRPDRGIGLGLAIVKQLVEDHGGHVWVHSTLGEGSTFSFTLPYAPKVEETPLQPVSEAA
jgi:signal transduction histidine kinase